MSERITVKSQFESIKEILLDGGYMDLADFVDGRIALLDKHAKAERKPTAKQLENEGFKSDILAWMEPEKTYTAGDVMKGVPAIVNAGLSINRVSALMTQLKDAGAVNVTVEKRKNLYTLAA